MQPSHSPTVYVVQDDSRKNMVGALQFGSVESLLKEREEATMFNIPAITQQIRYGLRHMTPRDYILCIGNPASIGIAFAVAADICGGRFNLLKWDPQERRYWAASVDLNQRGE